MIDREEFIKQLSKDWARQIINAGGDENVAQQAVALAALNGLFDHIPVPAQGTIPPAYSEYIGRAALAACDCQHPETTKDGFAAISEGCPIHGDLGPTLTTVSTFPSQEQKTP